MGCSAIAAEARIAVAANFRDTAMAIAAQLEAKSPHRYEVIVGSTGKLANQIINGAPFDAFLSADQSKIDALVERGLGEADSQAQGGRPRHELLLGRVVALLVSILCASS